MDFSRSNWDAGPLGEWLKKNCHLDGTLPFQLGETMLPEGQYIPEVLPIFSPAVGAGVLYLKLPKTEVWVKYAGFSAAPWDKSGECPVGWWLSYLPRWERARLDLVAAPDASIWIRNTDPVFGPETLVAVTRTGSSDWIPEPGTAAAPSDYVGLPAKLMNGADPTDPELTGNGYSAVHYHTDTEDPITVQPFPNAVVISQDNGQWTITIKNTNPLHAGGFAYEILPVRRDAELAELAKRNGIDVRPERLWIIEVRIVGTGYDIEVSVEDSRTQTWIQDLTRFFFLDEESLGELSKWILPDGWVTRAARLEVKFGTVDVALLPTQGEALPCALPPYAEPSKTALATYGPYLEAAIGFIPVVGTIEDVLHLTYMAVYRESFWGEKVGDGDILAQAIFTLIGVVADGADALKLVGLEPKLFGSLPGETAPDVRLMKTNPGWVAWLKDILLRRADPQVVEAVEQNRKALVTALEEYVTHRDSAALFRKFESLVTNKVKQMIEDGEVPQRMVAAALNSIHPCDFEVFEALDRVQQDAVLKLWNDALGEQRLTYRQVTEEFAKVGGNALSGFESAFADWRMLRAFSADASSFRVRLLDEGFRKYKARGGTKNAIQWAAAQRNGKYFDLLNSLIGADYKDILKNSEEYWELSPAALLKISSLNPATFYNTYAAVRSVAKDLGQWFQVDHVMEQRFFRNHPALNAIYGIGKSKVALPDISSILVPCNKWVGGQLDATLNNFPYIHAEKTARMKKLIPHGKEMDYSMLEMFDAHVLVMKYQLNVSIEFADGRFYDSVLKDQFMEVAKALVAGEPELAHAAVTLGLGDRSIDGAASLLRAFEAKLTTALNTPADAILARNPRFRN